MGAAVAGELGGGERLWRRGVDGGADHRQAALVGRHVGQGQALVHQLSGRGQGAAAAARGRSQGGGGRGRVARGQGRGGVLHRHGLLFALWFYYEEIFFNVSRLFYLFYVLVDFFLLHCIPPFVFEIDVFVSLSINEMMVTAAFFHSS